MYDVLTQPALDSAKSKIETGLSNAALTTVLGRCSVDYNGRASSTLDLGERHVMLKPDGTTLVHTDEGQKPVNWQPPGSDQSVRVDDQELIIESVRTSPDERLEVSFQSIQFVAAVTLQDTHDLDLVGTEADLKRQILNQPEIIEPGFTPKATERKTSAGAVDIFGEDADGNIVVLELKRRRVGPDAVGQLKRYIDALNRDLHDDAYIRGILVAPSVTGRARQLLSEQGLEFVAATPDC